MKVDDAPMTRRRRGAVLACRVDAVTADEALVRVASWAEARESRYVCACNVHAVVTAWRDPSFRRVVDGADLALPDGAPVAWLLRRLGFEDQRRVCGPDFMWEFCRLAERRGIAVCLVGSTEAVLERLAARLRAAFPALRLAGAWSPPFRPLTAAEEAELVAQIDRSGAGVAFVGLGCPKQERWIASLRGRVRAAMIGVGAAFEFHAGTRARAPAWMQRLGLEWLHRLASEPRRLWRRYLVTNALFVAGAAAQLVRDARRARGSDAPR
ncbi:MAG: WecB/TagA/CpsF family glycosyltransferase [Burkholderiales bacterium]